MEEFICGFVGFTNLSKDISKDIHILKDMNLKIQRKVDEEYYSDENVCLAQKEKVISIRFNDTIYTMVYSGNIFNKDEVREELKELDYEFNRTYR